VNSVFIALLLSFVCLSLTVNNVIAAAATDVGAPAPTPTPAETAEPPAPPPIPHFGVELTANRTALSIGETVVTTVTYRWPAGTTVVSPDGEPDPARDFAQAFVTDLPPPQRFNSGQEERRVFTITIAAKRDGAWELPRPTLTIRTNQGTLSSVAPPVLVQVGKDSAPPQLPPPRPIWTRTKAPSDPTFAWWLLSVVLVLTAGVVALALVRRRTTIIQQTPWDHFYDDWQAASAAADGKEAGARLSLGLRRCLGTVFRFDGPAATAKETITFLRTRLQDHEHRDLARLLEQLDGLRWAADDLPPTAVRPLLESGRAFTNALKHRLDAEAEAAKQAKSTASSSPASSPTTTTP
jgi:hypothetical protein